MMVEPPEALAATYVKHGWWNGATMQGLLDSKLQAASCSVFQVHSSVRPFTGSVADVAGVASRLAGGLRAAGIADGDTVAFQLPNWMEAAASFWGLTAAEATLVPIPHTYGPHEARHILSQTQARAVIIADQFGDRDYVSEYEALRRDLPALELIIIVGGSGSVPAWATRFETITDAAPRRGRLARPEDAAVVGYTSGTGASPKGVILSHRALAFEVMNHMVPLSLTRKAPVVGSPVSHVAGMLVSLLVAPAMGQAIHLIDKWDPGLALKVARAHDLNAVAGAAIFLTTVLDHADFRPEDVRRHLASIGVGGSPVPAALVERAHALGIWVSRTYGATEHPTVSAVVPGDSLHGQLFTTGKPLLGVDVKFVDGDGRTVSTGSAGELLTRGPDRCSGYLDPALTAEAIDDEGWLHTGDIGFYDDEGCVNISDRLKDIIIRGGENISAAEVEEQLLKYPGIAEVAVVAAPDHRYGERPYAFVRVSPGSDAPTLTELRNFLGTRGLSRQKWPEDLQVSEDLPRTASGKIKKAVLRERLRAGHGDDSPDMVRSR